MKRIYVLLLSLVIVAAVVTAISVGQVFTQAQLDGANVSAMDLNAVFQRDGGAVNYTCNKVPGDVICDFPIEYMGVVLETDENGTATGNYEIVQKTSIVKARASTWLTLKQETNATYMKQELKTWLKSRRDQMETDEQKRIIGLQSVEDEISSVIDSLGL